MIDRLAIEERVREWGLREDVVEKDYVLGWVLWGIGSDPVLSGAWVFKGGTCLKKCFFETYRFSEDLDFTVLPGGPIRDAELQPLLASMLDRVSQESGIDFSQRAPMLKTERTGRYTEGRLYYQGPRRAPVAAIRLDLSSSEVMARPGVPREISHPYPDGLPQPGTVLCYDFVEVFAEKTRALGERCRPRDLYDVVNIYRRADLRGDAHDVRTVLHAKCASKGVAVPTLDAVLAKREELENEWHNMLAHQLPLLPSADAFLAELGEVFAWLAGGRAVAPPRTIPIGCDEDASWLPPATVTTWATRAPLETIRFAGTNRLCVELGYKGSLRVIEPYSLRRTRAGKILLHAERADTGEHRSYDISLIESAKVLNRTFVPKYPIELASGVLPTARRGGR